MAAREAQLLLGLAEASSLKSSLRSLVLHAAQFGATPSVTAALLHALRENVADAGLAERCCWALNSLLTSSPTCGDAAFEGGAVELVLNVLDVHLECSVGERACGAVSVLAMHNDSRLALLRGDGVAAVTAVLRRHHFQPAAAAACAALEALSASPEAVELACDADAFSALAAALHARPADAVLAEAALAALLGLSGPEAAKRAAVEAGAASAACTALLRHASSDALLAERGCRTVASLAVTEAGAMLAAGSAQALLEALRAHPAAPTVAEQACGAFATLGASEAGRQALLRLGVLGAVAAAVELHATTPAAAESGAWALQSLVFDDAASCPPNQLEAAARAGVRALRACSAEPGVTVQTCALLSSLADAPAALGAALEGGAVGAVATALAEHAATSAEAAEQALGALAVLCCSAAPRADAIARGVLGTAATAVLAHPSDGFVASRAVAAMAALLEGGSLGPAEVAQVAAALQHAMAAFGAADAELGSTAAALLAGCEAQPGTSMPDPPAAPPTVRVEPAVPAAATMEVMPGAVTAMLACPTDAAAQVAGCHVIGPQAPTADRAAAMIAVVAALRQHVLNPAVLTAACGAMTRLCEDGTMLPAVMASGGVDPVVAVLRLRLGADGAEAAVAAAATTLRLFAGYSPCAERVVSLNGPRELVALLRASTSAPVHAAVLAALTALCSTPDIIARVLADGALAAAAASLERHYNDLEALAAAVALLRLFTQHASSRARLADAKVPDVVATAMSAAAQPESLELCAALMAELAAIEPCRAALLAAGALPLLRAALVAHGTARAALAEHCPSAVALICGSDDAAMLAAGSDGGAGALVNALTAHPGAVSVASACCAALLPAAFGAQSNMPELLASTGVSHRQRAALGRLLEAAGMDTHSAGATTGAVCAVFGDASLEDLSISEAAVPGAAESEPLTGSVVPNAAAPASPGSLRQLWVATAAADARVAATAAAAAADVAAALQASLVRAQAEAVICSGPSAVVSVAATGHASVAAAVERGTAALVNALQDHFETTRDGLRELGRAHAAMMAEAATTALSAASMTDARDSVLIRSLLSAQFTPARRGGLGALRTAWQGLRAKLRAAAARRRQGLAGTEAAPEVGDLMQGLLMELLNGMAEEASVASAQARGCAALANYVGLDAARDAAVAAGAVPALAAALARHGLAEPSRVGRPAALILLLLAEAAVTSNANRCSQCDAVATVRRALRLHPDSMDVALHGCRVLAVLQVADGSTPLRVLREFGDDAEVAGAAAAALAGAAPEPGAMPLLLGALQRHQAVASTAEACLRALAALAEASSEAARHAAGALPSCTAAMRLHGRASAGLCAAACRLLARIAASLEPHDAAHAAELPLEVLQFHAASVPASTAACHAFAPLVRRGGAGAIAPMNPAVAVVAALRLHVDVSPQKSAAALTALSVLCAALPAAAAAAEDAAPAIRQAMERHGENPAVCAAACAALAALVAAGRGRAVVLEGWLLDHVHAALQRHSGDATVAAASLGAIAALATASDELRATAWRRGVTALVVQALLGSLDSASSPASALIAAAAASAVAALACGDSEREMAAHGGAAEALCAALSLHGTVDSSAAAACSRALAVLAASPAAAGRLRASGCVGASLAAAKAHPQHAGVAENALTSLAALSVNMPTSASASVGDIFAVIATALTLHSSNAAVASAAGGAAAALGGLAWSDDVAAQAGVPQALLRALEQHCVSSVQTAPAVACRLLAGVSALAAAPTCRAALQTAHGSPLVARCLAAAPSALVAEEACRAIQLLAVYSNGACYASPAVISALVASLDAWSSPAVAEAAAGALQAVALERSNKTTLGDSGGVDGLLRALGAYPGSMRIHERCFGALANAAADTEANKKRCLAGGALDAIVFTLTSAVLDRRPDAVGAAEQACRLLQSLAVRDDVKRAAVANGCVDATLIVLHTFGTSEGLVERAAGVLRNLASLPDTAAAVAAAGAVHALSQALRQHPASPGVALQACCALGSLLEVEGAEGAAAASAVLAGVLKAHAAAPAIVEAAQAAQAALRKG